MVYFICNSQKLETAIKRCKLLLHITTRMDLIGIMVMRPRQPGRSGDMHHPSHSHSTAQNHSNTCRLSNTSSSEAPEIPEAQAGQVREKKNLHCSAIYSKNKGESSNYQSPKLLKSKWYQIRNMFSTSNALTEEKSIKYHEQPW